MLDHCSHSLALFPVQHCLRMWSYQISYQKQHNLSSQVCQTSTTTIGSDATQVCHTWHCFQQTWRGLCWSSSLQVRRCLSANLSLKGVKTIHLEAMSDWTTDAFLDCPRHFLTCHSKPSLIWSNHLALNSVNHQLADLYKFHRRRQQRSLLMYIPLAYIAMFVTDSENLTLKGHAQFDHWCLSGLSETLCRLPLHDDVINVQSNI